MITLKWRFSRILNLKIKLGILSRDTAGFGSNLTSGTIHKLLLVIRHFHKTAVTIWDTELFLLIYRA